MAQPKARGRRAAAPPLADLGEDPSTKRHIVVRSGRFGLYVTDGETNATLRLGDTPETMTMDRAGELLPSDETPSPPRAGAPATKKAAPRGATRAGAKKAGAKRATKSAGATKSKSAKKATGAAKRARLAKGAAANAALLSPREDE